MRERERTWAARSVVRAAIRGLAVEILEERHIPCLHCSGRALWMTAGGIPACGQHGAEYAWRGRVLFPVEAVVRLPAPVMEAGSAHAHQTGHHHRATLVGPRIAEAQCPSPS